ncbi:hypothetical protein GJ744_006436 [Endocarpon pusillum]|uniref:NB-ARC domain-containing protein n=1 Tax=Endocarpon pusillum TaxID=364733 RepID=A0A8H7A6F7_9EURO|nr:hypothetical protein GJ744_006436 [Endocarpon pusillum]
MSRWLCRGKKEKEVEDAPREEERSGLFALHPCATNLPTAIDIVAVHGLDGHWAKTWTGTTEQNWLRDFLPQQLRQVGISAHVVSFGYDSRTAFTKTVSDIEDVADMLLNRLKGMRQSAAEKSRPLIYIAHSLGGIVVKQAIIRAHERSLVYGDLLRHIRGIVFMGVPHRGADLAYWAAFAANIVQVVQLGFGTNANFVEALKRNSQPFAKISRQFVERQLKLSIRTFYETQRLGNQVIVDKDSAILNLANEVAVGLPANHRTICKFERADSQKYITVWQAIRELCQQALVSPGRDDEPIGKPGNVHWTVTRPLNSRFTGRGESLMRVEHAILSNLEAKDVSRRYVITGIGGQGKSELCLKVVEKLRTRFWGIFWVDVSTTTIAESGFLDIAKRVGARAETLKAALQAVANLRRRWMLVLDNADDLRTDYQRYIPSGTYGIVILTSRNPECRRSYSTIGSLQLEGLDEVDAQHLLLSTAEIPSEQRTRHKEDARCVADLLAHHPLALIQAGAYVARGHCTLSQYPAVYQRQQLRLLQFHSAQAQSRYRHVYATFEASAQVIESSKEGVAKDALDLLSTISMMSYSELPLPLFEAAWQRGRQVAGADTEENNEVNHLSSWHVARLMPFMQSGSEAWDSFRMVEACDLLKSLALISTQEDSDCTTVIVMHPLTHAWAQVRQKGSAQNRYWVSTGSIIALAWSGSNIWQTYERKLKPHLHSWLKKDMKKVFLCGPAMMVARMLYPCGMILHKMRDDKELDEFLSEMFTALAINVANVQQNWLPLFKLRARNFRNIGKIKQAVSLLEQTVRIEKNSLAEDHPSQLTSQHELAGAYQANGQVREAIDLLKHVVEMRKKRLAEDHPDKLASQHELARAYRANGQVREAIDLLKHVVKIQKKRLAEDHPDQLSSQHELAGAYRANGQVREAIDLLKHVVEMRKKRLAEDHPDKLASQHELARAYRANGQVREAGDLLEHVVKIQKKRLAEDHPDRLASQHELAGAYQANGQVREAVDLLKHVVEIRNRLAEDHPHQLASQHELARAYQANGQVREAIDLLKHVVEMQKKRLTEDHPDQLTSQHELARAYQANGQVREAVDLLKHVVEIRNRLAEDHPDRLASQHELARAYRANGQVREAGDLLEHVVKIQKKRLAEDHPDRLASQHELAGAYQANGQVREAIDLLKHVVEMRKKRQAEDHPNRLASQHELARAYRANGQVREAIDLLKHVVEMRKKRQAEDHPDRLASQHELAGAYRANMQVREAIDLLKHVVEMRKKRLAEDHPDRLASQHELARAYRANGQVREAIDLLEHVMKIQKKRLAEDHPNRLASQHELAGAYRANGQVREAIDLLKHVVKIQKKRLAEDHPDRLASQHELAGAYQANGQVREAIDLLKHVVEMRKKRLAEDHPDKLASQHELARAYQANGQVREAGDLLEHVVKIKKKRLTEDHPDQLSSQHELGQLIKRTGK